MAGQPLKRAVVAELERRAKERGEGVTALDVVCDWVASGETFIDLARDIGKTLKMGVVSPSTLSNWLATLPDGRARMTVARAEAAHAMAEKALEIIDEVDEDRDAIAKAKARADQRNWIAARWNRGTYGNDQTQVVVNLGSMHLDALRTRTVLPQLPAGDVVDAEVLAIEPG